MGDKPKVLDFNGSDIAASEMARKVVFPVGKSGREFLSKNLIRLTDSRCVELYE